jgi:hypothetical protein
MEISTICYLCASTTADQETEPQDPFALRYLSQLHNAPVVEKEKCDAHVRKVVLHAEVRKVLGAKPLI